MSNPQVPQIHVEVVDNHLFVSESVYEPGFTHKMYLPVEH